MLYLTTFSAMYCYLLSLSWTFVLISARKVSTQEYTNGQAHHESTWMLGLSRLLDKRLDILDSLLIMASLMVRQLGTGLSLNFNFAQVAI